MSLEAAGIWECIKRQGKIVYVAQLQDACSTVKEVAGKLVFEAPALHSQPLGPSNLPSHPCIASVSDRSKN